MKKRLLGLLLFGVLLGVSQIQINEIFADNGDCCFDESLETEDFVEIVNVGDSPIDIAGYYFGDQDGGSVIPGGSPEITTISSGGILLLWFDNDIEQGPLHVGAKLNNNGETVLGISIEGDTIINVTYGPQSEDVSYAALPDGSIFEENWELTMCPSPGLPNESCPLVEGCTSQNAINYNLLATIEDGTCVFEEFEGLMINEYSAANCDNDGGDCGNYEDWIEIYNNSPSPIDLSGHYLSDKIDNLTKWQFPSSLVVNAYSHVVVYAGGLDPELQVSNNTTNFKLTQTKETEYIILTSPEQDIVDYINLIHHQLNHSVGRSDDASQFWSIFESPTEGSENQDEPSFIDYKKTPTCNYDPGFYENQIELTISCDDTDVEIYYSLDGEWPDENSIYYGYVDSEGVLFSDSPVIPIENTTVVRVIAVSQSGSHLNSFVETNTYFINDFTRQW